MSKKVVRAKFSVGDYVQWYSQAGGRGKHKIGRVLAVIPAGQHVLDYLPAGLSIKYGYGMPRNHESYLVQVGMGIRLYWPRVSQLDIYN